MAALDQLTAPAQTDEELTEGQTPLSMIDDSDSSPSGALGALSKKFISQAGTMMPTRDDVLEKRQMLDDAYKKLAAEQAYRAPGFDPDLAGFAAGMANAPAGSSAFIHGLTASNAAHMAELARQQNADVNSAGTLMKDAENGPEFEQRDFNNYMAAQKLAMETGKYEHITDPYGNIIAYNPYNPKDNMRLGSPGPFGDGGGGSTSGNNAVPAAVGTSKDQLSGDDFLKQLPEQTASQVKALVEGRMPFPGAFALKSPYWQQMTRAVSQYDPSFDAVNYNSRSSTRKDFTSGKAAQNITALNTAMQHLGTLNDDFETLNNGDYPAVNKVSNYLGVQTGNPAIQTATSKVGTDANSVSNELAKVFRSSGMSQAEIEDWKKLIDVNNSPAQTKAVIKGATDLVNGRLDALGQQYNQGMGTTKDGIELLSPKAQETFRRLNGESASTAGAGGAQASGSPAVQPAAAAQVQSNAMPTITSKEEALKLPSGTHFIGPDGQEHVRK